MMWRILYTKQLTKRVCARCIALAKDGEVDAVLDILKKDQNITKILCVDEAKYQQRKEAGLL